MRELRCDKTAARHKVHQKIHEYYRRMGNRLWKTIGNRGHAKLPRAIMDGQALDDELV